MSNPATLTINGEANTPILVGNGPYGVAVSPNGSRAYVTNQLSDIVSVIDTATNTVIGDPIPVGELPTGGRQPRRHPRLCPQYE